MYTASKTLQSKNLFFSFVDDDKVYQKSQIGEKKKSHDTKKKNVNNIKKLPYLSNLFS